MRGFTKEPERSQIIQTLPAMRAHIDVDCRSPSSCTISIVRNELLIAVHRKGATPSQIGVVLRDSHGVAQVKVVTGMYMLSMSEFASASR